jgi:putative phage-type endonuclease
MAIIAFKTREEWLKARNDGIGGSEAAAVMGVSPFESALSLFSRKLGLMPEIQDNERMYWGRHLEEAIAADYERRTGRVLTDPGPYTIYRHETFPHMFCTPDRIIEANPPGILQIKTARPGAKTEFMEQVPVHYQVQLQHEMICCGVSWGAFAVFFGDYDHLYFDVDFHGRFAQVLITQEQSFWSKVKMGVPPIADDSYASRIALQSLYKEEEDEVKALAGDLINAHMSLEDAKQAKTEAERTIRQHQNAICEAIGDAAYGVMPDGTKYSWKTQTRKAYSVEASVSRILRRMK